MRDPEAIRRAKDKFNAKKKLERAANPELDRAIKEKAKAYSKDRYHRLKHDPEWYATLRQQSNKSKALVRSAYTPLLRAFKANGCLLCEEKEPACMHAHHVDPEQKEFTISLAISRGTTPEKVQRELAKCVCLCANCHLKLHAGLVSLPSQAA